MSGFCGFYGFFVVWCNIEYGGLGKKNKVFYIVIDLFLVLIFV